MRIRGERECTDCETRWSYYETGSVECPTCGSLRSVGVDERTEHTASPATLDLSTARNRLDSAGDDAAETRAAAERAAADCRAFVRRRGFIDAGRLQELDETYLAATELRHVAEELARTMRVSDAEEAYFLTLLGGADRGERPDPNEVPGSLRAARGLAAAEAVSEYRREVGTYLDDHPDSDAAGAFGTLAEHVKRVEALDGDVDTDLAERIVRVAQELSRYLREDDEMALVAARDRLSRLD